VVILFSKHFSGGKFISLSTCIVSLIVAIHDIVLLCEDSAESFGSSYHCEHLCDAFLYSRSRG